MSFRRIALLLSPRSPASFLTRSLFVLFAVGVVFYWVGLVRLPSRQTTQTENVVVRTESFPDDGKREGPFRLKDYVGSTGTVSLSRPACVFPPLELHDPQIMKFYKLLPKLECDPEPDWVAILEGKFVIKDSAVKEHGKIKCSAYPIVKVNDFKTKELDPITDMKNGTQILNDFFRVECTGADGKDYKNYHAGIRYDEKVQKRRSDPTSLDLDVIMIGLDSTSRLAWQRHLPKTRDYFVNTLNGTELEGYNILGDGTPAAIMPILLGKREEELPEARRGQPGAKTVDDFPWIWNDFKKAGYATAWGEDDASLGTFQYRLLGFRDPPTDHYFRYFSIAIGSHAGSKGNKPDCLRGLPRHVVLFDYMRQMYDVYPNRRKWIFSFMSELSHQDNNLLSKVDDDLLDHVVKMQTKGFLDNAVLIMMADHGGRFSKVRATAQGKQEERLPYFALRFPPWFHKKHPDIMRNLQINSKRLTTPFDIHETFHEMLNFTGTGRANLKSRAVSLFKEIPMDRDCDLAHVDPHWCACLEWVQEDAQSEKIKKVSAVITNVFNNYTAHYRDQCALLSLDRVVVAASLKVKDAVLKFKDTNDGGRGRFGKMTDSTKHSKVLYQVTLFTQPGGGRFEVTVAHNLLKHTYTLDHKDISRTNVYGNAPHCVEKKDASLRPFCFCKDLLVISEKTVKH